MAAFDLPWLVKYYDSGLSMPDGDPEDLARADSEATDVDLHEDLQGCTAPSVKGPYTFSLRANLLRWATLTPDLGIEWRISPSVGILVNGSWTSWTSWPSKDLRNSHPRKGDARRYALWEVMPEVRWYLGEKKAWYVGAMFKAGQFNYKFSGTGRQGDLLGGGITGGYHLRLTDALDMDFGLGLGYGLPERRYGEIRCDRRRAGAQRQRDEALDRPGQRRSYFSVEIILINGYRAERSWLQGGVGSRKGRGPTEWGGPPAATDRKHEKTIYTMKADNIYKTSLLAAALLLAATSCVKDTLYNTPHPDTGRITVTADWTDRGDGVDIPAEWTVVMGDYTGTETGETHAPDYLFKPGNYTLAAYNTPENILIDGTVARVSVPSGVSTGGSASAMDEDTDSGAGGFISGTPGWLDLTAAMHQQVRQLTLVIEPTGDAADRIESIEGSLSGAAGTLDFATGTYGTASDVALQVTSGIQTRAYDDQW